MTLIKVQGPRFGLGDGGAICESRVSLMHSIVRTWPNSVPVPCSRKFPTIFEVHFSARRGAFVCRGRSPITSLGDGRRWRPTGNGRTGRLPMRRVLRRTGTCTLGGGAMRYDYGAL